VFRSKRAGDKNGIKKRQNHAMTSSATITRVVLHNYKSIALCDLNLGRLTYLVGENGSGKSNFLDALRFVREALSGSLDNALRERGGINEVRRRSRGHPTNFGVRLELRLPDETPALYAFKIGALPNQEYEVQTELCEVGRGANKRFFSIVTPGSVTSSESTFPSGIRDRLALVAASGLTVFRPVFDALTAMGFYNLSPQTIRGLQKPQDGRLLNTHGENIASVLAYVERNNAINFALIQQFLSSVVPSIRSVHRVPVGPMESLEFRQDVAGSDNPWRFSAQNMSDGTLRALGILTALFQGSPDQSPSLIGIEEPETALHPAAAGKIRDALHRASETKQVIVTSHSPDLLDDESIQENSLLAVASREGTTHIGRIDPASRQALKEKLFTPGELLRINQIDPDPSQQARHIDLFSPLGLL
jgi:predicted ATPase